MLHVLALVSVYNTTTRQPAPLPPGGAGVEEGAPTTGSVTIDIVDEPSGPKHVQTIDRAT